MKDFDGAKVVVTGAGQGIGRACARLFAARGAHVACLAQHEETAAQTRDLIHDDGGQALAHFGDLGFRDDAIAVLDRAMADLGGLDVLVNNAGWTLTTPFLSEDIAYWERVLAVNLWAPIHLTRRALEVMVPKQKGAIVNVVSDAGRAGTAGEAVYSAAKGGVAALTKSLAQEMARFNIRLNAVSPGLTNTRILTDNAQDARAQRAIEKMTARIPMRRIGEPDEIATAVVFLASDEARYITGQVLSVNGGLVMG